MKSPSLCFTRAITLFALALAVPTAVAFAQTPTLAASSDVVVPGTSVTLTVTGTPGAHYAIVGSIVGAGGSYAGLPLAVGADYVTVAQGMLDGLGVASVPFVPPFLGSIIDRVYLQAATTPSLASPTPPALSVGRVLRNHDLVAGLAGAQGPAGPAGMAGEMGPMGAAGPAGPAGPAGAVGVTGATGLTGATGPQGLTGAGLRTDCGANNVVVWDVGHNAWACSSSLTDLVNAVQALTTRIATLESPVDAYLDSLTLSSGVPIGTSLAILNDNGGSACIFNTGSYYLQVHGSDNQNGYPGGMVLAYSFSGGSFYSSGNIPVNTAQVLARCATAQPYVVAR